MSERWSYQIRKGFFFAILIVVANKFSQNDGTSFIEEIATLSFWLMFSIFLIFSIFIFGYLLWKTKQKGSDYNWSDIFRKKIK
jgi:hypothetical protein